MIEHFKSVWFTGWSSLGLVVIRVTCSTLPLSVVGSGCSRFTAPRLNPLQTSTCLTLTLLSGCGKANSNAAGISLGTSFTTTLEMACTTSSTLDVGSINRRAGVDDKTSAKRSPVTWPCIDRTISIFNSSRTFKPPDVISALVAPSSIIIQRSLDCSVVFHDFENGPAAAKPTRPIARIRSASKNHFSNLRRRWILKIAIRSR